MRVLLLFDTYEDHRTGAIVRRLCQRWAPMREISLTALAFGHDGPLLKHLRAVGVGAQTLPEERRGRPRAIRDWGRRTLFRNDRPDVIHSFCAWPDLAARQFHSARPDVPLVTTVHDLPTACDGIVGRLLCQVRERMSRRGLQRIIVASRAAEQRLLSAGLPARNVRHLHTGVDAVQTYPLSSASRARYRALMGVDEQAPLIVCAAPLEEREGVFDLVDAMPAVIERVPSARLFLIGDGDRRADVQARIDAKGVATNVRIVGSLSEILARVFSAANLVVVPTREDRYAIEIIEAQATAKAVVATRHPTTEEMLVDGQTGILVPPGDPGVLGAALANLLQDQSRREEIGQNARSFVLERFELGATADGYTELWRDLAPDAEWKGTDSIPLEDLEEIKRESTGNFS